MRITNVNDGAGSITLKVEGRISGIWADELQRAFDETRRSTHNPLVLDLTSVTFIDDLGKHVLKRILGLGAEFVASGCHTRCIVEELLGFEQKPVRTLDGTAG